MTSTAPAAPKIHFCKRRSCKFIFLLLTFSASVFLSGCGTDRVYTLYRNSVLDQRMRIHIATFDAAEKSGIDTENYNQENCEIARGLFQNQSGVKVRYWCELGRYRG